MAKFLLGPAPLDELADLTPDVGHSPQGHPIEDPALGTEERDHAGHFPPIQDRKGERAVEAGVGGERGAGRCLAGDVLDRSRTARCPHPTQESGASAKRQFATARLEDREVLEWTVPGVLET